MFDKEMNQVGRFGVFRDKDDEPTIYYFSAPNGNEITLTGCAAEIEEDVLKHLQATIDINVRSGNTVEEIDPEDDFHEGKFWQQKNT